MTGTSRSRIASRIERTSFVPKKNCVDLQYDAPSLTLKGAKGYFEFIGEDKDRQLESLWKETKIGRHVTMEGCCRSGEKVACHKQC
jgi:hypothetical protein